MNRDEIKNYTDMAVYLKEKAYEATRLYHYTTYESLLNIIDSKSFRLSKINLLNDKKEMDFGNNKEYFILSLTGNKEYISMWSMYGKPSGIKIRIDFPKKPLKKCLEKSNIYEDSELRISYFNKTAPLLTIDKRFDVEDCTLCSVAYLDKDKKSFKYNGKEFSDIAVTDNSLDYMSGFIKYDCWEFEKEIRVRVKAIANSKNDYVYIKLSDELLEGIAVTFNPWMPDKFKKMIRDNLDKKKIMCCDSSYDGQINEM